MTKVTWKGEDTEDYAGPSYALWNGVKFPKDVAVEVTDPHMLGKARTNQYFKVQEESHGESQTQGEDKVEDKKEDKEKGYRENRTGYSPVKKKVRKKKLHERPQDLADDTAPT